VPTLVGHWDRTRIAHVVSSLLSNATKFGAGAPVEVSVARHDGIAELTVRDHGIGIPKNRLPFLFERFERCAPLVNYAGLGLGLFVARSLVLAHQGAIRVDSEQGAGTTFTVDLHLG
jgi:signal transduction histidine kinase